MHLIFTCPDDQKGLLEKSNWIFLFNRQSNFWNAYNCDRLVRIFCFWLIFCQPRGPMLLASQIYKSLPSTVRSPRVLYRWYLSNFFNLKMLLLRPKKVLFGWKLFTECVGTSKNATLSKLACLHSVNKGTTTYMAELSRQARRVRISFHHISIICTHSVLFDQHLAWRSIHISLTEQGFCEYTPHRNEI